MKNLLLLLSVLLSTSLSALELLKEIEIPNGYRLANSEDALYDGSYVIESDGGYEYMWYNSNNSLIRSGSHENMNSYILCYSNNYLVIVDSSYNNKQIYFKSTDPSNDLSFNYTNWNVRKGMLSFTNGTNDKLLFYKLDDYSQSSSSNSSLSTIPSNAVVIPSDSSGPVQIILESSEDMVNWNSANPGTYGASTNERFFRVRAVEDTE